MSWTSTVRSISHQIVHQFPLFLAGQVLHYCPVSLLHLAILEHLVQTRQCLTGLGKNNKTAHGAAKYAGSWKDNRDSDEINDDIYASRLSRKEENFSPFDE